ncbi:MULTISPECIES: MFS transporter [unclassified Nocardiopsis]|uniref:MFS transporter n=1 Tax=unclassified Nocardiopsis TaxID=2649073 RepID=UPI00093D09F0|nr:MFS transporter [Nocardiopsis sp. TSRI0078]
MTGNTHADAQPRAGAREWTALAVLALPTLLLSIDLSVLLLALPHLTADLGASGVQLLWITDIYGFMVAGFLLIMGTLGDRIGCRKLLLIGAVVFGLASVAAAFSASAWTLILTRAVLGVAGASLMPCTLALVRTIFRDPRQRGVAVAVWMSCFMVGFAVGPIAGGLLLQYFWWGSVFLLGVPVMALLLVVGPFLLPETPAGGSARLDLPSTLLVLATVLPVIYGTKEITSEGVSPAPLLVMALGVAMGVVFVVRQRGLSSPLLDLGLFGNRSFSAALLGILLTTFTVGGVSLFVTQYLQLVEGLSPLVAGLWLLPAAGGMIIGSMAGPVLIDWVRPAYVIAGGLVAAAAGCLFLATAGTAMGLGAVVFGYALVYFGTGPMGALGTDLVVGSAPEEKAGAAAGMSESSGEFGIALGIAMLGSIGTAVYQGRVPGEGEHSSLAGTVTAAGEAPSTEAAALLETARDAFVGGLNAVSLAGAAVLVLLAVVVSLALRHVPPAGSGSGTGGSGSGTDEEAGAEQVEERP